MLKKRDCAGRKVFCASGRCAKRQLQHQIGSVFQGGPGPGKFVKHSRRSSLDVIAAHGGYDIIGSGQPARLRQMEGMSQMEGVVFRDHSNDFHNHLLYGQVYHKYVTILQGIEQRKRKT